MIQFHFKRGCGLFENGTFMFELVHFLESDIVFMLPWLEYAGSLNYNFPDLRLDV